MMEEKLQEILKLTVSERLQLLEAIWDSIASEANSIELSDEHKRILDEELAAYEKDPNSGSSWEEVKNRIRTEFIIL